MSNKPDGLNDQSLAVNQLIAEFMSRTDAGESLDVEQFIEDHSEHAAELRQHFANVDLLEGLRETDPPGHAETILKPKDDSDQSTDDVTANTVMRGGTDSETSVTRQFEEKSTSSATNLEIPETFGRYAIQKVLGQGAMGAVYLARDTQLDRDVALKIPKFGDGNGVDDEELLERFYREARASATLRSPNICPVHDVGEIDGQHYITMAYIEGRPLKDFTKSKKQHSEKQIITTIRKLALGLAEAHEIGVIHRDLKPANIMVDKKGEPVVMDFGLARRSASDDVQVTRSGAILGTPAYMAPEQVAGDQAAINHQVDIYALGVIMYELITNEMPFKGNLMAILQQIALNNPTKPSDLREGLDPRLEKICLKMMAGDQTKRYQSMDHVARDLNNVLKTPNRKQKKEANKKTGPKPTAIPSANEESNPALISIEQPKSYAEQLREKKGKSQGKASKTSTKLKTASDGDSTSPNKKMLIAGGLGGLFLLLGIIFFVRVGKYDVQITLDDPSITLSVDGEVLNIKDGEDVYKLSAGGHKLQLQKEGLKTHVEDFAVTKDGKTALIAKVVNGKLDALLNGEGKTSTSKPLVESALISESDTTVHAYANVSELSEASETFALEFDGNGYVDIPIGDEKLGEEYTLEAWVEIHDQKDKKDYTGVILNWRDNYEAEATHRHFVGKTNDIVGARQGPQAYQHAATTLFEGRKHLAIVRSEGVLTVFVDGERKKWTGQPAGDGTPFKKPYRLSIGAKYIGREPFGFFYGRINEVRVSNVARYDDDFQPKHRLDTDESSLALYHFDEGFGDVLKDSSGNGHHGKIVGAKWVRIVDSKKRGALNAGESTASGNYALKFDGTNSEPFVTKLDNEEPIEEYTVEAWVTSEGPEVTKNFVEVLGPETGAVIRLSQNEVSGWMAYRFHAVVEESPGARVPFSKERTHVARLCPLNRF